MGAGKSEEGLVDCKMIEITNQHFIHRFYGREKNITW